jgi:hypothetical protein
MSATRPHSDRYDNVPARDAAARAEYDRQEEAGRETEEAGERNVHFFGRHPTDPYAGHGDHCVDSCPYDTPGQARAREKTRACVEAAREAGYAEAEAGG